MKARTRFATIVTITILSLAVWIGLAQAQRAGETSIQNSADSAGATVPWQIQYVERVTSPTPMDLGAYNSIALRPYDELPFISYYDATNHDLKLASPVYTGGSNCGVDGNWWCRVVDETGDVGKYNSIALWGDESHWKLGISYYDTANYGSLKYAEWDSLTPSVWDIATIAEGNMFVSQGLYTSLELSSDGTPHIAYYMSNSLSDDALKYATYYGINGNCGVGDASGKWHCETVDSGDRVGKYPSLDIGGYDDWVRIAYYDEGLGNLNYASYGIFGTCDNGWNCEIANSGGDVGLFPSLAAPQAAGEPVRIAYYDKTNGALKYATSVSSDGNCGSGDWVCYKVDDMGAGAGMAQTGIALALDEQGEAVIVYQDASEDLAPASLNIARPASAYDLMIGNCGDVPPGYLFMAWQCGSIDNGYSDILNEADYVSAAVNSSGLATIAYYETDDYYLNASLKVAYQHVFIYLPIVRK